MILFPAVLLTMPSPSMIGTPLDIMVERVLENLDTATFFSSGPKTGDFKIRSSTMRVPFSVA